MMGLVHYARMSGALTPTPPEGHVYTMSTPDARSQLLPRFFTSHRSVVGLLFCSYVAAFVDRGLVAAPIKHDLHLSGPDPAGTA
jgi:hypothetical protein